MDEDAVIRSITDALGGVDVVTVAGNDFFFYDPGGGLPVDRRFPFATLMTNDVNDQASNLDRPSVYRLNIGVSRETFRALFAAAPPADADEVGYDFTALDRIMPHPVYGRMNWICVLNPSEATFQTVLPLLAEAYARSAQSYARSRPAPGA